MFCTQCGASNPDNALTCAQCGRSLQPGAVTTPLPVTGVVIPPGTSVPNYLVFAILTTVFCCLPTGIPAIVYAAQVNGKLQAGDLAGAQLASKNAKTWCWVSFGVGLGVTLLYMLVIGVGVIRQIGRH
jgi:hypothetical protein